MCAFVHLSLTSLYPAPHPTPVLTFPHHPPTNSRGHARTHAGASVPPPPRGTNDPANYVFKVFGSCENSFGLAVEGGGGSWREVDAHGRGVVHGLMAIITARGFCVNTGLVQRRLIEERAASGGSGGGVWHRDAGASELRSWVSPRGGSPSETFTITHRGSGVQHDEG